MNKQIKSCLVALFALALLCVPLTAMADEGSRLEDKFPKPAYDGILAVVGTEGSYKVVSVNTEPANHSIVMEDKSGKKQSLKLGPEVRNFSQIKVGDFVVVSENAQLLVYYDKAGQVPGFGQSLMVYMAPKGEKPGLIIMEQNYITLQIAAVDATNKTVTIVLPDNTSKTVNAPKVDYSKIKVGHDVVVQMNQEKSIMVVAPK